MLLFFFINLLQSSATIIDEMLEITVRSELKITLNIYVYSVINVLVYIKYPQHTHTHTF